jgi:hypothetical protein
LRTLVVRRAWGDVLRVCGHIYVARTHFALLSLIPSAEADSVDIHEFAKEQKHEVVEILALECRAWFDQVEKIQ